jgi:hypothetical protein
MTEQLRTDDTQLGEVVAEIRSRPKWWAGFRSFWSRVPGPAAYERMSAHERDAWRATIQRIDGVGIGIKPPRKRD